MRKLGLVLGVLFATACGGGSGGGDMAAPAPDLTMRSTGSGDLGAIMSQCGQPGDKGNALGVGSFCTTSADCAGNSDANICTHAFDSTVYFCTLFCSKTGAANQCGDGATCECMSAGCGCTPNACLGTDDGGAPAGDGGGAMDAASSG